MGDPAEEIIYLASESQKYEKTLLALGDKTRQSILRELLRANRSQGLRVGEIAARAHLSRSAASHHLQILRDAGVLSVRREETKLYYSISVTPEAFHELLRLLARIEALIVQLSAAAAAEAPMDAEEPHPSENILPYPD